MTSASLKEAPTRSAARASGASALEEGFIGDLRMDDIGGGAVQAGRMAAAGVPLDVSRKGRR